MLYPTFSSSSDISSSVPQLGSLYPYLHGTYGKIRDFSVLFSEPEKDEIERVLLEIDTRPRR